jgi:diketogulonate reductase-like aldo/keto reductase
MEFKKLGRSQVRVPEIGFGTWNYAGGVEPLRAAIEHGACLIDTAEIYGTEGIVGAAVRGCRDRVFLATKVAPRNFRHHDLIAAAEQSLRRLGTDYIDLYQLHWPNYTVPIEESMAAMEELVDAGKIRFIGVSNFSIQELKHAQAAMCRYGIVSNQVRYSLIERTIEGGLLKYCQQNEITVIAYSPLGGGFQRMRDSDPERVLAHVAKAAGKAEAQIGLNWLIAKDKVLAIPKASTAAHAVEDCGASCWRLSQNEYTQLEAKIQCKRRVPVELAWGRWKRHLAQSLGRQL